MRYYNGYCSSAKEGKDTACRRFLNAKDGKTEIWVAMKTCFHGNPNFRLSIFRVQKSSTSRIFPFFRTATISIIISHSSKETKKVKKSKVKKSKSQTQSQKSCTSLEPYFCRRWNFKPEFKKEFKNYQSKKSRRNGV